MNGDQCEAKMAHPASLHGSGGQVRNAKATPFDDIHKHIIMQQEQIRDMTSFVCDKCDYLMGSIPKPETARGDDAGPPPGRVDQVSYALTQTDQLIAYLRDEINRLNGIA